AGGDCWSNTVGGTMRGGLRFAIKNLSGLALLGGLLSPCSAGPAANQIAPSSQSAPVTVTLQDALTRAQANEPQYHAALTEYGVAKEQRMQSRAAVRSPTPILSRRNFSFSSNSAPSRMHSLKWNEIGWNLRY